MTYFAETKIKYADSPAVDAFGRLRVGEPYTLFDNKQLFDISDGYIWSTKTVNGGTAIHSASRASTIMTVSTAQNSQVIRQTKQRMNYQPGKSLLTDMTFVMGPPAEDVIMRAGLFDEKNGFFLEQSGSNINFCIRSSISGSNNIITTRVSQSQWNLDKLDGSGVSSKIIDLTKIQILTADMQWLGAGRVRIGFNIEGNTFYAHEFNHSNIDDSVYMSSPNLPVRYEIVNSGSNSSYLEQICITVVSEGGYEKTGILHSVDRGVNTITINSGSLAPALSIRLNPANIGITIFPQSISIITTTNSAFLWALYFNPTIAGTDNVSWQSISGSVVQYDVSRDTTNTVSNGIKIASGYGAAAGAQIRSSEIFQEFESRLVMGSDIDGNTDELVLAVQPMNGASNDFAASISWREFV